MNDIQKQKITGFLSLLTKGLIFRAAQNHEKHLGNRENYVGMSDIGKAVECLRSAVASKLQGNRQPSFEHIDTITAHGHTDQLMAVLKKLLILQRGHWLESGVLPALCAFGVKTIPQLEIDFVYQEVPIKAHLDFTLVWGGARPAVRVVELKSNERIPDHLYASYETQLYGQVSLLKSLWDKPCFGAKTDNGDQIFSKITFPQAVKQLFDVEMPDNPDLVDIEGWVLSIAMSDIKPFGPYYPDQTALSVCLTTACRIWNATSQIKDGTMDLNEVANCHGFNPLCDWCDHNEDCPKFQGPILEHGTKYDEYFEQLDDLTDQKKKLEAKIQEMKQRIQEDYSRLNSDLDAGSNWITTGNYRFRVGQIAGRNSLNKSVLTGNLSQALGDRDTALGLIEKSYKPGKPYSRLFISKVCKK